MQKEEEERRVAASDLAMVLLLHPAMSSQRLVHLPKGGGGKGSPGPRVQDAIPRDVANFHYLMGKPMPQL